MSVFMRIAMSGGMIMLLLAGITAVVLYGWLPEGNWAHWAVAVVLFNVLAVLSLFLMWHDEHRIPGKIFLSKLIVSAFIWQLLFDVLGIVLGVAGKALQLITGWSVSFGVGTYLMTGESASLVQGVDLVTRGSASVQGVDFLLVGTAALALYSVFIEPNRLADNRFDIPVEGMDRKLDGFTIAQLSDVHLGAFVPLEHLRKLLEEAARQRPHVLVLTGDIFDDTQNAVNEEAVQLIDSFVDAFPDGIYYVWGNHEYYRDVRAISKALTETRIHVLRNSCRLVQKGVSPLYFAGVDYPFHQGVTHISQPDYVEKACEEVPAGATLVMLAHHPDFFPDAAAAGAVLTLSGHTHGGQMGFLGYALMPPVFKYVRGMYQKDGHYCYVHKGNGGRFPYRLGCMPEIAYFTLKVNQYEK